MEEIGVNSIPLLLLKYQLIRKSMEKKPTEDVRLFGSFFFVLNISRSGNKETKCAHSNGRLMRPHRQNDLLGFAARRVRTTSNHPCLRAAV